MIRKIVFTSRESVQAGQPAIPRKEHAAHMGQSPVLPANRRTAVLISSMLQRLSARRRVRSVFRTRLNFWTVQKERYLP